MALGMAGDRIEAHAIPGLDTSMAWAHRDAWPDGVPTTRLSDMDTLDRPIAEQQAEATASIDPLGRVSDNDTDDSDAETEGNSYFEGVAVRIIHLAFRRMLVAITWPDPGLGDLDAHEWASTPTSSDRRIFQGGVGSWSSSGSSSPHASSTAQPTTSSTTCGTLSPTPTGSPQPTSNS